MQRREPGGHALQRRPHLDHLDDLLLRLAHDEAAAPRHRAQESFLLEQRHRFADRRARHAERLAQLALVEADLVPMRIDVRVHDRLLQRRRTPDRAGWLVAIGCSASGAPGSRLVGGRHHVTDSRLSPTAPVDGVVVHSAAHQLGDQRSLSHERENDVERGRGDVGQSPELLDDSDERFDSSQRSALEILEHRHLVRARPHRGIEAPLDIDAEREPGGRRWPAASCIIARQSERVAGSVAMRSSVACVAR